MVKGSPLLFCHHFSESHCFSAGDKGQTQPAGASLGAAAGFCGADLHHRVLLEFSRCWFLQELTQSSFSRKSAATKPASHCSTTGYQRHRASVLLSDLKKKKKTTAKLASSLWALLRYNADDSRPRVLSSSRSSSR